MDKDLHFARGLTNRMRKDNYLVRTMNIEETVDFCVEVKTKVEKQVEELFRDSEVDLFATRKSGKGRKPSAGEDSLKTLSVDQMLQIAEFFVLDELWLTAPDSSNFTQMQLAKVYGEREDFL